MDICFSALHLPSDGVFVIPVTEDGGLPDLACSLDQLSGGQLARSIAAARFKGKKDQILTILAPSGTSLNRVVLVGLGKPDQVDSARFGGNAVAQILTSADSQAVLLAQGLDAAQVAFGARLRSYRFDKYRTKEKPEDKPALANLTVLCADPAAEQAAFADLDKVAEGVFLTRDVVSEPPNVIYPASLAQRCLSLTKLGVDVQILGVKEMQDLGMGALLGVGQGSSRESQMVVMRWQGGKPEAAPLALVGKGVCFDSGGISLKPGAGMEDMKWDMAGAGAVIGAMAALAGRKAKANVVGVVGLVENMPSGTAQRPSDVVTTMSGQTVEIINTDAEGRLVLADAITYTLQICKPVAMIDLATLTGAIIISLGHEYAGLFSNDDALAESLLSAGKTVQEPLWRMPMADAFDQHLKSDIADMKNTGQREGGSISAAHFLKRFVGDLPWAHLDIAGTAWGKSDTALTPKGATAFGVRLLNQLVADRYEQE